MFGPETARSLCYLSTEYLGVLPPSPSEINFWKNSTDPFWFPQTSYIPALLSVSWAVSGQGAEVQLTAPDTQWWGHRAEPSPERSSAAPVPLYWATKQGCKQQQSHQRGWHWSSKGSNTRAVQQHSDHPLQATPWWGCTWYSHHPHEVRVACSTQAIK